MGLKERIGVAFGEKKPELVLKNARIVNVFINELERGDIAVSDGYIVGIGEYDGETEIDLDGAVVCPGLIDGHIHIESSMLSPSEFAKAVVPHGTTAVITDPHEIANVAGTAGIDYMLKTSENLPLEVFFMLPSCVPATGMDESGAELGAAELEPYYKNPRVLGLAEMMNAFGTVRGDEGIIDKINGALEAGKIVDGHAPALSGKELNAYITAGVKSDHECSDIHEAIEKVKRGQWIMIREGTAAKNLAALIPLFGKKYYSRCMLVTDDKHPGDLIEYGHIDYIIREAAKRGENPIYAIKMASFNTASYFGLKDMGAIAPGYRADFLVLSSLDNFRVRDVYKGGKLVASEGKLATEIKKNFVPAEIYEKIVNSCHVEPLREDSFKIDMNGKFKRVIGLVNGELLTNELIVPNVERESAEVAEGVELSRNIVKLAVVERHKNTGHVGVGFVYNYGLRSGAICSSIAHDSHNLIVIGTNDRDMALAANAVIENQGGLSVVNDGKILGTLALPIAGLMCERDVKQVEDELSALKECCYRLGVSKEIDPFMTLGFVSLPVIPQLRLTTHGLFDVGCFETVPAIF